MLRVLLLCLLSTPALAAPGQEAAMDLRCAALMSRVSDALEAGGHHSTLTTVRSMQASFLRMADNRDRLPEFGLARELARTPPVALPASSEVLASLEACAARLPR